MVFEYVGVQGCTVCTVKGEEDRAAVDEGLQLDEGAGVEDEVEVGLLQREVCVHQGRRSLQLVHRRAWARIGGLHENGRSRCCLSNPSRDLGRVKVRLVCFNIVRFEHVLKCDRIERTDSAFITREIAFTQWLLRWYLGGALVGYFTVRWLVDELVCGFPEDPRIVAILVRVLVRVKRFDSSEFDRKLARVHKFENGFLRR